ncbi:MAG: heparan-alpha-glucosaminide N-acetyltransferase domain-containing protein [Fischerella sp.]|nr:heparan-alpha-glucosaminide N-acetyltransferase domain-containing protein [Fischerella sp.]
MTHLCAPSFVFLAGIAAYLSLQRYKNKRKLSRLLFTRGLCLVFLELTVISFAWTFNPTFFAAGVVWAIGWSMVVLAALIQLPTRAIAAFGILLIVGYNLFDNLLVKILL